MCSGRFRSRWKRTACNPDFIADDFEEARRIIGDRIGVAVAGIRIDRRECRDRCSSRCVFINGTARKRDVGWVFVDQIVDGERDGFGVGIAAGIGDFNRDVVVLVRLKVDGSAPAATRTLVADNLEEARRDRW